MRRALLYLLLIPLLLILLAVVLVPLLVDKEQVLALARDAVREQTGADLSIGGEASLSVFPTIGLALEEVDLVLPDERQPALNISSLVIGVRPWPLLGGRVLIDTLALDEVTARLPAAADAQEKVDSARLSDAELDAFYARRREQRASDAAAQAGAALAVPLALEVRSLSVSRARLRRPDASGAEADIAVIETLQAGDLNLAGRPISLQLALRLPGKRPVELALTGRLGFDQSTQLLDIDELDIEARGATRETLTARLSGSADIGLRVADLKLKMAHADMQGDGRLRYAEFESPTIDAHLHLNRLDPALLVLAGPEAATEGAAEPAGDGDEPLPLDALRDIDTRAELSIDQAMVGNHPIQGLQAKLRAQDGVVQLESLTGALHGGQLAAQATFDGSHNTATLASRGELRGMALFSALQAAGIEPVLSGTASLDWDLRARGGTRNELLAGLTGPVRLTTGQAVLENIAIERMLCEAVALTNQEALTAEFPASTTFQALQADISLAGGKAHLAPLKAELEHLGLEGKGDYELATGEFDLTLNGRLSPELETVDRACRVSKRLTAIDWPVTCAGSVHGDPDKWCRVDTKDILEDLGRNELQRKVEKKAGKLLDKLFNN